MVNKSNGKTVSMSDDWYELTDLDHFWVQWRFRILKKLLINRIDKRTKIFEIGCGNGLVILQLEKNLGLSVNGCDLNPHAIDNLLDISGNAFIYDIYDLKPEMLEAYDCIILLDVIEHIDNDKDFLETALKYLRSDGFIVIGVPAFGWLFSKYDSVVGHKRRYRRQDINTLFEELDVEVIENKYWGMSLVPLLLLRKFVSVFYKDDKVVRRGFKPPGRLFNWIMIQIMKIETNLLSNPILGTSVLSIARKRKRD